MRRALALALLSLAPLMACTTTPATPEPAAPACPATRGWSAFTNAMPGPGAQPTLIVTGQAEVAAGLRATLRPGATDRMMPPGQRIVLALEPAPGMAAGWQDVRAEIKPALPQYREVIVTCGGEQVFRIEGSAIVTAH